MNEIFIYIVFCFVLVGLSVSILYVFSRSTFRKWIQQIFIFSGLIMLIGFAILFFSVSLAPFAPFLFIPIYTSFVAFWIEKQYYKNHQTQLRDTSFWWIFGERKSSRDNNWNTILLLSIFVVPTTGCMFLMILIKDYC